MVIYKITNRLNGKIYIGQTSQPLEKRFYQHSKANTPLGNAMRQCGLENFTIEIVEKCHSQEEVNDREKFWIGSLNCKLPCGYNQSDGGESCTVKHFNPRKAYVPTTGRLTIGEALRRFRQGTGLNQEEVAEKLGIKRQAYQPYETGKVTPSVNMIIKMANVFDVTTDYLLGRSDTPHPTEFNEREVREAFAFRDAWAKAIQHLPQLPQATA